MRVAKSEGAEIAYSDEGQRAGVPLVLIMGLGGSAEEWGDDFLLELRRQRRVVRFHNRGVGLSSNTVTNFTFTHMARDVIAVIEALGLSEADVLGYSMGGMVAQRLVLDYPERVRRLVLMATHFGGPEVVQPQERVQPLFERRPPGESLPEQFRRFCSALAAPGFAEAHMELAERFAEGRMRNPVSLPTYQAQMTSILSDDRSARVQDINVPTLVVHGDQDALVPVENGRLLAGRVPGATLHILPGCGHLPTWEQPQPVLAVLARFLD